MKKQLFFALIGLAFLTLSCDKHRSHYGTYDSTETRSYDGVMMASDVDLSDQNYLIKAVAENENSILLENIYEHGTAISTAIDGSALTINKQSLDGFLEIEGNGTIGDGVITLNYNVITPDGNVVCNLNAGKVE